MKKLILSLSIILLLFSNAFAYEFLYLVHVDQWGWVEGCDIEEAAILVEPQGMYARCELILDFSSGYVGDPDWDVLEVEMGFHLPPESHVTDLYLWIEDEPVQAYIFDTWTASLIYESIVQRRIDPAILVKTANNEYNLKVYPIYADFPRRIKMEFITPINNLMGVTQSVPLPFNILNLSMSEPDKFKVAFKESELFGNPAILEESELEFQPASDPDFGECSVAEIENLSGMNHGTLIFNRKDSEENFFLAKYENGITEEKYFELAIDHDDMIGLTNEKKAVYLLDFVDGNCDSYDKEDLLESLKYSIQNNFNETDSFNVIVSGLKRFYLSDDWIAADSASIESYFDSLSADRIRDYSRLPQLLLDGISFTQEHGNAGSLLLISSANSPGSNSQVNSLITEYLEIIGDNEIQIHIIDLNDRYYENEYFYSRLSQMTTGEYYSSRNYSLPTMLEYTNNSLSGYFRSLELFIQTDGGYSYSNYRLRQTGDLVHRDNSIRLTGKYLGEPPFNVSLYGQISSGEVFHIEETILPEDIYEGDSIIESVWSANYMRELMGMEQSNQIMNQIIHTSIERRILTRYTAFLVLEPDFVIPENPEDPGNPEMEDVWFATSVDPVTTEEKSATLSNYPNPFTSATTISYSVPELADIRIVVYNTTGQLIEVLVEEELDMGDYTFELEASEYEKGLYFCIMQVNGEVAAKLKLVVM